MKRRRNQSLLSRSPLEGHPRLAPAMQIVVTFTGPLRTAAPIEMSVPEGTTLAGMCRILADAGAGDVRRHLLSAAGGLEPTLLVAVNGVGVPHEERPRRILCDGDDVLIMPPVAGG